MSKIVKGFNIVLLLLFAFSSVYAGGAQEKSTTSGKIEIEFAEHVVDPYPFLKGVIKAFEAENPNVSISITGIDTDTHRKNIMMAAQANNLPDIFWIDEDLMVQLVDEGMLLEMKSDLISAGVDKNMSPDMFNQASVNGGLYGLPSERLITGYWVNKKIFRDNGIELPKNFNELVAATKIFNSRGIITISNGAKSPFSEWTFEAMIGRFGFFDHWDGIITGNDSYVNEDFIKFYEKIEDLASAGAFNPSVATVDYSQAMEVFKGGRSAMVDSGAWLASELESVDFAQDVGFWFGPTFSDGVGDQYVATMVGGGPYVVSSEVEKDPAKKQAILDFFAFLYGEKGASIIADDYNALPVSYYQGTPDSTKTPAFASLINALNDTTWKSLENQPSNVMSSIVQAAFYDSVYGLINKVYTPREAAQLVQDAIEMQ